MNKRQPITIADKTWQIGFSFRAIKLFEETTGKSITNSADTWDNLVYAWCSLRAINPEFDLTLDQFVDVLDQSPELLIELQYGSTDNQPTDNQPPPPTQKKKILPAFFGLWTLSVLLLLGPVLIPVIFGSIWIFRSFRHLYRYIAKAGNKRA